MKRHDRNIPVDGSDELLLSRVRPSDWPKPSPKGKYDMVVIGGGTAGLVTSVGAASLGASVALVEKNLLGGDCLNYGCVPSKAFIRASKLASLNAQTRDFGMELTEKPKIDFPGVMEEVRKTRAELSVNDSAERLKKLGIDLFFGTARFKDERRIDVDGETLVFGKCVIATGTKPRIPDIPGIDEVDYLTNETVFSLNDRQGKITVVGGGPIGCEMSQAFARLGWIVTLITRPGRLLPREDPEVSETIMKTFTNDGIRVITGARVKSIRKKGAEILVHYETSSEEGRIECDEILIATGRLPNTSELNLEAAGIEYDEKGIVVDDFLKTTNKNVYAAGDVCLPYRFTHVADATARIVIRNSLFFGRNRVSTLTIPWCTYTQPEVARVTRTGGSPNRPSVIKVELADVDRAVTDRTTEGFMKILYDEKTGKIFDATLVAENAGEIISSLTVAMSSGIKLWDLSRTIFPYPTLAEIVRKCADESMRRKLTDRAKKVLRLYFSIRNKTM